jgi:hypothetical protein
MHLRPWAPSPRSPGRFTSDRIQVNQSGGVVGRIDVSFGEDRTMSVSVRSTPSTALITLARSPSSILVFRTRTFIVPGTRDVVALENLLFLRNARQEAPAPTRSPGSKT